LSLTQQQRQPLAAQEKYTIGALIDDALNTK